MRAALGTTGDVKALIRANTKRQRRGQLARWRMRLGAARRTGACGHAQQRIVRPRHEVVVTRHLASAFGQDHTPGCQAQAGREIGEDAERIAVDLPERQPDQGAGG